MANPDGAPTSQIDRVAVPAGFAARINRLLRSARAAPRAARPEGHER
jgi:hypothetical protein